MTDAAVQGEAVEEGRGPTRLITRRRLLTGGLAAGVAGAAGLAVARHPWAAAHARQGAFPDGRGTLVLLTVYGGNDGLNTVVPYQDGRYLAAFLDPRSGSLTTAVYRDGRVSGPEQSTVLPAGFQFADWHQPQPLPLDGHMAERHA